MYSFDPEKGFTISQYALIGTPNVFYYNPIHNVLQHIYNTIQLLKTSTNEEEKVQKCSRFFKLNPTDEKRLKEVYLSDEICTSTKYS
jgi:hypothetical protein